MRYLCLDESVKNLWAMALDGCDVSQSHSIKSVWSPAGQVVGHPGDDLDDVDDVIAGCCDVGVDDDELDDGDDGGEGEYMAFGTGVQWGSSLRMLVMMKLACD